jgi:hypothetical protein
MGIDGVEGRDKKQQQVVNGMPLTGKAVAAATATATTTKT